jgi:hypothetical protein
MNKRVWIGLSLVACLVALLSFFAPQKWIVRKDDPRGEILSSLPTDASAVLFLDLNALRQAQFFAALLAWAPKPQADPDYAQFIKDTGFDYERDLDRIAIAAEKRGNDSFLFAVVDGRFDRKKITTFALKTGSCTSQKGREICSVPASDPPRKISFTFWKDRRLALTNSTQLLGLLNGPQKNADSRDWQTRFERLAGSPVFAVVRQDAAVGAALAAQAPGGWGSPQLSILLDQLQWITVAGIPESDRLRLVTEGESPAETAVRQLADLLNGVVLLAQAGLNDAKTRQQLNPSARQAYLELLNSVEISRLDRGDSKAVRVVLEITPSLLESARTAAPGRTGSTQSDPQTGKTHPSKKGRT